MNIKKLELSSIMTLSAMFLSGCNLSDQSPVIEPVDQTHTIEHLNRLIKTKDELLAISNGIIDKDDKNIAILNERIKIKDEAIKKRDQWIEYRDQRIENLKKDIEDLLEVFGVKKEEVRQS
ncbi:MAG: hypothetical protein C4617_03270 [Candidatus Liberibacter europaeus]|uniref:Uncharacterized protein n=1 Tax=Candidatus Liberibacter europaeus TaxID=744859 RepID=A0A2T4VYH9_9HYPH|nr:MAG: hypothetical protein C4617_03270 [Candidatus Liberibacter europaeus]